MLETLILDLIFVFLLVAGIAGVSLVVLWLIGKI